jgi:hypothetical protein
MRVTLDIFSGRPNPSWVLDSANARRVAGRFSATAGEAVGGGVSILGYRGFVISAEADDEPSSLGLPHTFRVELPRGVGLAREPQAASARNAYQDSALWVLSTAGRAIDDDLAAHVESAIKGELSGVAVARADVTTLHRVPSPPGCTIRNTAYLPAYWNAQPIQPFNNCYNYAMNFVSNTVAQPGRISGRMYHSFTCRSVSAAASADGCRSKCGGAAKQVALVIWPNVDFHWFRLHPEGFWAHKVGVGPALNIDNQLRVIGGGLTPENCDRGPYTDFCGYRFSPVGMRVD